MAFPGAAARPSRRFLIASGVVLVASVAITLLISGGWLEKRRDPDPPDVWHLEGTPRDLRLAPDGDPLTGWTFAGFYDTPGTPGAPDEHELNLWIEGRPSALRTFIDNEIRKDPQKWMREQLDRIRTLRRMGEPVETSSGRWWLYSTRRGPQR